MVFLAYGSTAVVARQLGAGNRTRAIGLGIQAMWLAVVLGVLLAVLTWLASPWLLTWLGVSGEVHAQALAYPRWSLPGLPGMLLVLAATGTLRGLADGRTPMVLAIGAASLNVVLDLFLVFGLNMGIAGSGATTAIVETAIGVTAAWVVWRGGRRAGAPMALTILGMRSSLQVTWNIWGFLNFALDALGIAGRTLIGMALGAGAIAEVRALVRRMLWWSLGAGVVLGGGVILLRGPLASLFSPDAEVRAGVTSTLLVIGCTLTIAAYVCLADGVLIGAGDGPYLARVGVFNLIVYVPLALVVARWAPAGPPGLVWLWAAFSIGFMGIRALTLAWRQRGGKWLTTGA